jgi:hypothetical protein
VNQNWWQQNVNIFPCYMAHSKNSIRLYLLVFCGPTWPWAVYIIIFWFNLWVFFVHIIMTHRFDPKMSTFFVKIVRELGSHSFSCLFTTRKNISKIQIFILKSFYLARIHFCIDIQSTSCLNLKKVKENTSRPSFSAHQTQSWKKL